MVFVFEGQKLNTLVDQKNISPTMLHWISMKMELSMYEISVQGQDSFADLIRKIIAQGWIFWKSKKCTVYKADLLQVGILFGTQFPSPGIFIRKKLDFEKTKTT